MNFVAWCPWCHRRIQVAQLTDTFRRHDIRAGKACRGSLAPLAMYDLAKLVQTEAL